MKGRAPWSATAHWATKRSKPETAWTGVYRYHWGMPLPEPDEDAIEVFERLEENGPNRAAVVRLRLALGEAWPPEEIPSSREGIEFSEACGEDPLATARWCAELEQYVGAYLDAVTEVAVDAGAKLGGQLEASEPGGTGLDAVRKAAGAAPGAVHLDWSDRSKIRTPRSAQTLAIDLLGVEPDGAVAGVVEGVRRRRDEMPTDHDEALLIWAQAAQLRSLRPAEATNAPTDPRLVSFRLHVAWAAGAEVRAQALSADHPSLLNAARRVVERNLSLENSQLAFTALAVEAGHDAGIEAQQRGPEKRPRRFTTLHMVLLAVLFVLFVVTYVLQK